MNLKPKALRRLLVIGGLFVTVAVLAVALVFVRSWQNQRRSDRLRADGMAALASSDYYSVLDNLAGYLRRKPKDREAWLAFAEAREKIEEADGKHLPQAALAYSRALALDTSDTKTARTLLRLYGEIGFAAEAKDLARTLRPANIADAKPEHADILFEEASALVLLKDFRDKDLDPITEKLLSLSPDNPRAGLLRAEYLLGAGRKDDAVALAESLPAAHPGDPRFEFAYMMISSRAEGDRRVRGETIAAGLARIAGLKLRGDGIPVAVREREPAYTDADFALRLARTFEDAHLPGCALVVLRDAATRLKDKTARQVAARRQFQYGLPADLLADNPTPDLSAAGDHPDTIAFLALAARDLGRKDDAARYAAALKARPRHFAARAWSTALEAIDVEDPKQRLALLDQALKDDPTEPILICQRGDTLRTLGRMDEARQAWTAAAASPLAATWSTPLTRTAESFLDEGRVDEGLSASENALQRNPDSGAAHLINMRAFCESVLTGRGRGDAQTLLERLNKYTAGITGDLETTGAAAFERLAVPARAALLASMGRATDAKAEISRALGVPGLMDANLARRLAQVSLTHGLGLEERILKGAGEGSMNPLDRAMLLESQGQREQALALLDQNLKDAAPAAAPEAATIRAQFLDATGDPRALDAWKSTVEAAPTSLPAILAALRSRAVPADRALVESLTAKLTALGGNDPDHPAPDVRLARVRATLAAGPDARGRDEAVSILRALVIEAPARADIRETLVDALLLSDAAKGIKPDPRAAAEQLTAAAAAAPDRGPFTIRLAQLQASMGARNEAAETLTALSIDNATTPTNRLRAVDGLTNLGAFEAALRGLAPLRQRDASDPELAFREATLLTRLSRTREALDGYRRLAALPLANAGMIVSAAIDLRLLGQPKDADAMLAKLDNPSIPPVTRALGRGDYLAGGPDPAAAAEQYAQAITLDPKQPKPYLAAARFHRARKDLKPEEANKAAEAAARQGLAAVPGNNDLEVLLQQVLLAASTSQEPDLNPLADALAKNPATARRAQALRAVAQAQKTGALKDPNALVRLAGEFSDDPTVALFCARALISMGTPQMARAANILATAAPLTPEDPDLQELAARCLIDAGRGAPALEAADRWRRLTGSPNAIVAAAEARVLLGRPDEAANLLRTLPAPKADDSDLTAFAHRRALARTQVARRESAKALDNLRPMIATSARTRSMIAVPLAAESVPTAEEASAWLTLIAAHTPADAAEERLNLAQAWRQAAGRFPAQREAFLRSGLAVTEALTADEKTATAEALTVHAAILQGVGSVDAAIAAASKARTLAPDKPDPLIALANALMAKAADPSARKDAVARAAEAAQALAKIGNESPGVLLRAAGIFEALGDAASANAAYERAITLTAGSPSPARALALNNLAFALVTGGPGALAAAALDRAKALADEAVAIDPQTDYYETLGYIESARQDREKAASAYRRAIQSASPAKAPAAMAGLAGVLAAGDNRQRSEAAELVKAFDEQPALIAQLSPLRKSALDQARRALGLPSK